MGLAPGLGSRRFGRQATAGLVDRVEDSNEEAKIFGICPGLFYSSQSLKQNTKFLSYYSRSFLMQASPEGLLKKEKGAQEKRGLISDNLKLCRIPFYTKEEGLIY